MLPVQSGAAALQSSIGLQTEGSHLWKLFPELLNKKTQPEDGRRLETRPRPRQATHLRPLDSFSLAER